MANSSEQGCSSVSHMANSPLPPKFLALMKSAERAKFDAEMFKSRIDLLARQYAQGFDEILRQGSQETRDEIICVIAAEMDVEASRYIPKLEDFRAKLKNGWVEEEENTDAGIDDRNLPADSHVRVQVLERSYPRPPKKNYQVQKQLQDPELEDAMDIEDPLVETTTSAPGLGFKWGVDLLDKITALTTAVEDGNKKIEELTSSLKETREELAALQKEVDKQAEMSQLSDAAATKAMGKIKGDIGDLRLCVENSSEKVQQKLEEYNSHMDSLKETLGERAAGRNVVILGSSAESFASEEGSEYNENNARIVDAPVQYCFVDFQKQRHTLLLTKTEVLAFKAATCHREVIRRTLLKYYTPIELQQLTLSGRGGNGEARPKMQRWLVKLIVKAINTVFPQPEIQPGSDPTGLIQALLDEELAKQEPHTRRLISSILQYYRDTKDAEGKSKRKKAKKDTSTGSAESDEDDDEDIFHDDNIDNIH